MPIPSKPSGGFKSYSFPGDLVTADRGNVFYTQIYFTSYSNQFNSTLSLAGDILPNFLQTGPTITASGGFSLPLPNKINEVQTVTWEAADAVSQAMSLAQGAAGAVSARAGNILNNIASVSGSVGEFGGAETGKALNPQLYMLFKSPNFKEHQFSWTFTPNNEKESNELNDIINYLKKYSLPSKSGNFLYNYPSIAMIQFKPNDAFAFKIKPCALVSVNVDYSGGGRPSFFKNGAPTVVNLGLAFKEIELWTQDNYNK
jgi:hypothetical protein